MQKRFISSSRAILARSAAALVGLAVGLAMTEAAARLILDNGMHFDVEMWKYARDLKRVSDIPGGGHEHRPLTSGVYMGVPVSINAFGQRDREIELEAADGVVRTMMLGDSLTFGWGVAVEETPSKLLEGLLNEAGGGVSHEVINTGVGNTNTAMQVAYFLAKGQAFHPDTVVLNYFINDAEPTPHRKGSWLVERSMAVVMLASAVDKAWRLALGGADWREYYRDLYTPDRQGWAEAQDAIAALAEYCRAHGINLLVVNYPELHELSDYPFARETELVRESAEAHDLPFVDLTPSVHDLQPESLWVSPTDAHPNLIANRRFAPVIEAKLREAFPQIYPPIISGFVGDGLVVPAKLEVGRR